MQQNEQMLQITSVVCEHYNRDHKKDTQLGTHGNAVQKLCQTAINNSTKNKKRKKRMYANKPIKCVNIK